MKSLLPAARRRCRRRPPCPGCCRWRRSINGRTPPGPVEQVLLHAHDLGPVAEELLERRVHLDLDVAVVRAPCRERPHAPSSGGRSRWRCRRPEHGDAAAPSPLRNLCLSPSPGPTDQARIGIYLSASFSSSCTSSSWRPRPSASSPSSCTSSCRTFPAGLTGEHGLPGGVNSIVACSRRSCCSSARKSAAVLSVGWLREIVRRSGSGESVRETSGRPVQVRAGQDARSAADRW